MIHIKSIGEFSFLFGFTINSPNSSLLGKFNFYTVHIHIFFVLILLTLTLFGSFVFGFCYVVLCSEDFMHHWDRNTAGRLERTDAPQEQGFEVSLHN